MNALPLGFGLRDIVDSCATAVLVKDEAGYCIYANLAAEKLLGYDDRQLEGAHITELCPAEPALIETEFERLKRDRFWFGSYSIRRKDGSVVQVGANAIATETLGGRCICLDFLYPSKERRRPGEVLTGSEQSLLQLTTEDLDDRQLAMLLGIGEAEFRERFQRILQKLGSRSRTEACVKAMKTKLIN